MSNISAIQLPVHLTRNGFLRFGPYVCTAWSLILILREFTQPIFNWRDVLPHILAPIIFFLFICAFTKLAYIAIDKERVSVRSLPMWGLHFFRQVHYSLASFKKLELQSFAGVTGNRRYWYVLHADIDEETTSPKDIWFDAPKIAGVDYSQYLYQLGNALNLEVINNARN